MSKTTTTKWSGKEIGVTIGFAFLLLLATLLSAVLGAYIAKAVLRKKADANVSATA